MLSEQQYCRTISHHASCVYKQYSHKVTDLSAIFTALFNLEQRDRFTFITFTSDPFGNKLTKAYLVCIYPA